MSAATADRQSETRVGPRGVRPQASVRVFVVSDVALLREGLTEALTRRSLDVVGAAATAAATPAASGAEVVLLDVTAVYRADTVRRLAIACLPARVVAIAVPAAESEIVALVEAGIAGYVTLEDGLDRLVATIESAARDEALCSPRVTASLLRRLATLAAERGATVPRTSLTARELEIAALLRDGLSNKEISLRLSIELSTVKNHVHHVLDKLGVDRRAEVGRAAFELALPPPAAGRVLTGVEI